MKHVYLRFNLSCGHAARHLSKSGSAAGVGLALLRAGGGGRLKGPHRVSCSFWTRARHRPALASRCLH